MWDNENMEFEKGTDIHWQDKGSYYKEVQVPLDEASSNAVRRQQEITAPNVLYMRAAYGQEVQNPRPLL